MKIGRVFLPFISPLLRLRSEVESGFCEYNVNFIKYSGDKQRFPKSEGGGGLRQF